MQMSPGTETIFYPVERQDDTAVAAADLEFTGVPLAEIGPTDDLATRDLLCGSVVTAIARTAMEDGAPKAEAPPEAETTEVEDTKQKDTWQIDTLDSLANAAATGDRQAGDQLLAEIHLFVSRYCRNRLSRFSEHEATIGSVDDVIQEVCLAVIAALPTYVPTGLAFKTFVYSIAAHKVTDAFRAVGRNRSDPVADLPDTPAAESGPEEQLLATEFSEYLGRLLGSLAARQREILRLRIAMGLSAEATAVAVGSTPGAVRVAQHRALGNLRNTLDRSLPKHR